MTTKKQPSSLSSPQKPKGENNMSYTNLISITQDPMNVLKHACSKPYGNIVSTKGVQAIIASGHLSILEHCYASFDVACSVRVLGQLTRHRHLSFTVQSSRGTKVDNMMIPSTSKDKRDIDTIIGDAMYDYQCALDRGESLEDAAYLLPQGAMTKMVITGNFRAWYEYLPKRLCKRALREHQVLAQRILLKLQREVPEVFGEYGSSFLHCENCKEKGCTFHDTTNKK